MAAMKHILDAILFLGLLTALYFFLVIAADPFYAAQQSAIEFERQSAIAEMIATKFGVQR
jgi:hypothetical protein